MRVFGLSGSGMDIDQMVSDLMRAERARTVHKLGRKKQTYSWKQEFYQDMNRDIAKFIIDAKDRLGLSGSTLTGKTYDKSYENMEWVKKILSTDTDVATGTATSKALDGKYKLVVNQLAEGISKASTSAIGSSEGTDKDDKLSDQFANILDTDEIKFTITTDQGSKSFTFNGTQTLDDIISEVNSAKIGDKKLGVKMSYDSDVDRIFINSTETGADVSLKIEDNDSTINGSTGNSSQFFSDILKIDIDDDNIYDTPGAVDTLTGKDLEFDFGDAVGLTKSSNTFSINGINITAKELGTTTINVETDVDGAYDKIKEYIDEYNKLIDEINTKLSEKVYRDYQPLTEEERKELSESEIEKWEDRAKSGLFRNDSILSGMISDVRLGLYDVVEDMSGSFNQLTQIGITTGKYSEKGKLVIDDFKLKEALSEDASGVMELLFKQSDSDDEETKYKESGLITRMFDSMEEGIKDIIDKAGPGNDETLLKQVDGGILVDFVAGTNLKNGSQSVLAEYISDLDGGIFDEERRLIGLENKYYSKYSAMENALAQMNSQSNWLVSQLGGF